MTDHIDFLVMQPDYERQVIRDLLFAVMAFNTHARSQNSGDLQVSFPLFDDVKVARRARLGDATTGPVVRITGPARKLAVLATRYEISAHLRAGRAFTLERDRAVVDASLHERFGLIDRRHAATIAEGAVIARPVPITGQPRLAEMAGALGAVVADEAIFVQRTELAVAQRGVIDPLGFSWHSTVPVARSGS
ncbi:MAG: hypothetical protein H7125_13755 [Proteobacteria bacterium]|nr:hypothetical protein [Burkholderiales bacterium]